MYIIKFKAMAECSGFSEAIVPGVTIMTPTAFANATDKTTPDCLLFLANRKTGALFVLGQESPHGLAMFQSTVTTARPHGMDSEALAKMEQKFRPSDTAAELELDSALEQVKFSGDANTYYNAIVKVRSMYAVGKSDSDLIKLMARKINSATYSKMIIDHLNAGAADDFEAICSKISTVQRLAGIGSNSNSKKNSLDKEIAVVNADDSKRSFKGKCNFCERVCGYREKDCPLAKKASGGGKGGGSNKQCNFCGGKGHIEDKCWKKHPEKAPQWIRDKIKKSGKDGKETGGVEVVVASVEDVENHDSDFQRALCWNCYIKGHSL
jgi:hypothetical protein